jgi:hypothetical protein
MFNSFWFWLTVYLSVILILYIIELCFESNYEIKHKKKYQRQNIVKCFFYIFVFMI